MVTFLSLYFDETVEFGVYDSGGGRWYRILAFELGAVWYKIKSRCIGFTGHESYGIPGVTVCEFLAFDVDGAVCVVYARPDKERLVGFENVSVVEIVSERAAWEALSIYVSTEKV